MRSGSVLNLRGSVKSTRLPTGSTPKLKPQVHRSCLVHRPWAGHVKQLDPARSSFQKPAALGSSAWQLMTIIRQGSDGNYSRAELRFLNHAAAHQNNVRE